MAQPQLLQVKLSRFDAQPWGFRLQGGVDFAAPLLVQKVNAGSLSEQAGLQPGDAVLKINDVDVFNLRHKDAQDIVVRSGNNFVITVQRGGSTWRPHVTPTGNLPQPNSPYLQTVTKTSLAHKQQESQHIGCGYNNSARPFANGGDGSVKSIVNKQYNTPVGIYSDESIAETLSAQAEVLAGGVLGVNFKKNEKEYQADKSEVLKFLREEETGPSTPEPHSPANFYWTQSHAIGGNERRTPLPPQFQQQQQPQQQQQQPQPQQRPDERVGSALQQNTLAPTAPHRPSLPVTAGGSAAGEGEASSAGQPDPRVIVMPICPALQGPEYKAEMDAAAAALASDEHGARPLSASGHPACQLCGVGIVGVFVRIKDKNLHVECFKCATCGTSLKNQGYYNFNNKLYCDIHAKLAAQQNPPAGTDGYVPVPIKPNTKLSATTISSALNAHGYNNGVSNGNSTPTPAPVANPIAITTNTPKATTTAAAPFVKTNNIDNNNIIGNMSDEQSIYGQINAGNAANTAQSVTSGGGGDQPFEYVTLTGNVIRSVVPPGKGVNLNYKVNQGFTRPYGAAAGPPAGAPRSPVSYPPQGQQQQWGAPQQQQQAPRPAGNPYATLPRSNVGQQEQQNADNDESLQPQYAEECYEEDVELAAVHRTNRSNFAWPPPKDEDHEAPTAAPLYIPPPETQHVVSRPVQQVPPLPPGNSKRLDPPPIAAQQQQQIEQQQQFQQQQVQYQQANEDVAQQQWQSRSAPQLTTTLQTQEQESSSESYTSTSTTTTTTSEEYQRMYAAQVQAYQMQQAYEQSGSELDYQVDYQLQEDQSYLSSTDYLSGRRSAQECVDSLVAPLSTYKLIDMVREVTPSPVPNPVGSSQGPRHVAFVDEPEVKEVPKLQSELETIAEASVETNGNWQNVSLSQSSEVFIEDAAEDEERLIVDSRREILESQRIFQPTPEIKIEIPPVRQIPPTKIPNPIPKEWINPMINVLTTAPEVPFHLVECPFPKPCDSNFEAEASSHLEHPRPVVPQQALVSQPKTEIQPLELTQILRESPPRGTLLSKAMATAPEFEMRFAPPGPQPIPLPEETEPYMPPPIEMKPYLREDFRPKSPFVSALTVAPEKPFEGNFERDVPIHLLDLPTPKEHLSMSDALCTASDRAYTPLNPENAMLVFEEAEKAKEKKKHEFQVLTHEEELGITPVIEPVESVEYYTTEQRRGSQRKSSAFAAMQAFQPSREPLSSKTPRNSVVSFTKEQQTDLEYQKYCKAQERNQKRLDYFHKKEEEIQQQQQIQETNTETHTRQEPFLASYTNETTSSNSSSTVQQLPNITTTTSTYASNSAQASRLSFSAASASATECGTTTVNNSAKTTSTKIDARELIEETAEELEHSEVLFPPPSPLSHLKGKTVQSGLHKADTIPKYQRNWTVLPTQSPIRTPEPQELRENIPLAFVDAPKAPSTAVSADTTNTVYKPVAQISTGLSTTTQKTSTATASAARGSVSSTASVERRQQTQLPTVPIIIEDRSGPVTMAFQSLDEYDRPDQSQTPTRPYTPSLINKPAPIVPFYQTAEKLCFDECPASHARAYDRRSASPFPDRARSPAPGPPPNPLSSIRAPRMKEPESNLLTPRVQQGSITTGQSYLGAQQLQQQQQGQVLSHSELSTQSGSQSYTQNPETITERKVGDLTVQRREQESRLEEQKQRQLQSETKTQIGNTQIERRRKVTEEYEHKQSAKTIEIRTGSQSESTERRESYGRTGFVANQARRLSGLEQEITNLTSQSQAISARAAQMGETTFPQLKSPTFQSKFPLKPVLSPHDESAAPNCIFPPPASSKLVGPPPGFQKQCQKLQQQNLQSTMPTGYSASTVSTQQQKSLSAYTATSLSSTSSTAQASLTKASALTTTNNNQAYAAASSCRQQALSQSQPQPITRPTASAGSRSSSISNGNTINRINGNNGYRPNASAAGLTGLKPTLPTATAAPKPVSAPAPAPAPSAVVPPNISDNKSNVDGSAGAGGKGGAFGATSAPKRGRGVFNNAVGPGVRVPLCNSCNVQIRGPFITALGRIWCPDHFICVNANCRRPLQDIGFVEEKGDLYCEYCFEKYLAPTCSRCSGKIKGDCLNAIGKHFHPECFTCAQCGKIFGNTPFFLEDGNAYCEADWNELFTTKCYACGFPVEAGDRWVEALNHNYHSQCFNCTYCKQNLEGQSFYNKGGRPFCKNHAR